MMSSQLKASLTPAMQKNILVIGGNGFVGSAVCRSAVRRGWKVQSISKSGKPFTTPNGHLPAWTEKVEWHTASAFEPTSYQSLLSSSNAVVHTLGTLFDGGRYKQPLKDQNPLGTVVEGTKSVVNGLLGDNPLERGGPGSYENMNRESAITVCKAFISGNSATSSSTSQSRPGNTFVYVSAEDVFRPAIPARYITTKREAERMIQELCSQSTPPIRSVMVRPSFIYHPHFRPISSPIAALIAAAGGIHQALGGFSPLSVLTNLTRSQRHEGNALDNPIASMNRALTIPPIHVDHVGEAICAAIEDESANGPLDVWAMRRLLGWVQDSEKTSGSASFADTR
ncbi:hypothetical protein FRC18_006214 [Serendipita sp. 400]|nr:hypothetical protein FRC18_006214 [Serendipita sp. 400]